MHTISRHHHRIDSRQPKQSAPLFHNLTLPSFLKRCWLFKPDDLDPHEHLPLLLRPQSFAEKYGSCQEILHYGAQSSVRLYTLPGMSSSQSRHPRDQAPAFQHHVVKVFRPSSNPSIVAAQKIEQAISSALSHPNICRTRDVLLNERGEMCQIIDYCAGGNLNRLIATSPERSLDACAANCFFKQIMRAIVFLHDNGIAHCDLKMENVLLTPNGAVKVADFGSVQWYGTKMDGMESNETESEKENGICHCQSSSQPLVQFELQQPRAVQKTCCSPPRRTLGSIAYLPPEEFGPRREMQDYRIGDVWAAGLIYMAMRCGRLLWRMACEDEDGGYRSYLHCRQETGGYFPIEELGDVSTSFAFEPAVWTVS